MFHTTTRVPVLCGILGDLAFQTPPKNHEKTPRESFKKSENGSGCWKSTRHFGLVTLRCPQNFSAFPRTTQHTQQKPEELISKNAQQLTRKSLHTTKTLTLAKVGLAKFGLAKVGFDLQHFRCWVSSRGPSTATGPPRLKGHHAVQIRYQRLVVAHCPQTPVEPERVQSSPSVIDPCVSNTSSKKLTCPEVTQPLVCRTEKSFHPKSGAGSTDTFIQSAISSIFGTPIQ